MLDTITNVWQCFSWCQWHSSLLLVPENDRWLSCASCWVHESTGNMKLHWSSLGWRRDNNMCDTRLARILHPQIHCTVAVERMMSDDSKDGSNVGWQCLQNFGGDAIGTWGSMGVQNFPCIFIFCKYCILRPKYCSDLCQLLAKLAVCYLHRTVFSTSKDN